MNTLRETKGVRVARLSNRFQQSGVSQSMCKNPKQWFLVFITQKPFIGKKRWKLIILKKFFFFVWKREILFSPNRWGTGKYLPRPTYVTLLLWLRRKPWTTDENVALRLPGEPTALTTNEAKLYCSQSGIFSTENETAPKNVRQREKILGNNICRKKSGGGGEEENKRWQTWRR